MSLTEDFNTFFNPAELGDAASFSGIGVINGIFEKAFMRTSGDIGMENSSPALRLPNLWVPANVIGRTVTIKAVAYTVVAKEPDEMPDITVLILENV